MAYRFLTSEQIRVENATLFAGAASADVGDADLANAMAGAIFELLFVARR